MQPIHDFNSIIKGYPNIKLSYETVSHKKVSAPGLVSVAIPQGKKHILWTTVRPGTAEGTVYLLELGKTHQNESVLVRGNVVPLNSPVPSNHKLGSVVHGTLLLPKTDGGDNPTFIIDDIYMFQGQILHDIPWGHRAPLLAKFMRSFAPSLSNFDIAVAVMWGNNDAIENSGLEPGYSVRYIQHREFSRVAPYVNVALKSQDISDTAKDTSVQGEDTSESTRHVLAKMMPPPPLPRFIFQNPQFRLNAVFLASADVQYDVYNLFAMGKAGTKVFVGLAGVQSYKTSVFMNGIFRKIRENRNLDYIEESDDEGDFENVDETKHVDLEKCVAIECVFNPKIKKWVPLKQAPASNRVTHISALTQNSDYRTDDRIHDSRQPHVPNNRRPERCRPTIHNK